MNHLTVFGSRILDGFMIFKNWETVNWLQSHAWNHPVNCLTNGGVMCMIPDPRPPDPHLDHGENLKSCTCLELWMDVLLHYCLRVFASILWEKDIQLWRYLDSWTWFSHQTKNRKPGKLSWIMLIIDHCGVMNLIKLWCQPWEINGFKHKKALRDRPNDRRRKRLVQHPKRQFLIFLFPPSSTSFNNKNKIC